VVGFEMRIPIKYYNHPPNSATFLMLNPWHSRDGTPSCEVPVNPKEKAYASAIPRGNNNCRIYPMAELIKRNQDSSL
jgi:hypothetical protein